MRIELAPFCGAIGVSVCVSPMVCAIAAGKLWDQVPQRVPSRPLITVWIDAPSPDPDEAVEIVMACREQIKETVRKWLISPVCLN